MTAEKQEKRITAGNMPARYPVDGTFELTVRCNLHCAMCLFRHDESENREIRARELTAGQWIDLADQAAEAGTVSLLITGGEPMLRRDFCEIWEGIYRKGFIMTLYTNAALVTDRIMETLRKYPPHRIGITIYGASAETYGAVCGDETAFERVLKGVEQLMTLPSEKEFRTTIIKDNLQDFEKISKIVEKIAGVGYNVTQTRIVMRSVRGACTDVAACRLDPEENVRLAYRRGVNRIRDYIGESFDEKNLYAVYNEQAGDSTYAPRATLFGCDAGMQSYTISWDGKLLGCQLLECFPQDVLGKGLAQAWEDFPFAVRLPELNEKCARCEDQNICNCCCASRYAETGDLGGFPEYVCRDTAVIKKLLKRRIGDENEKL